MAKNLYDPKGLGDLDPDDHNSFQTARRQARSAYDIGKAQNQFKLESAGQDYASRKSDLRRQYGRARRAFGSDFTQRGLLNSGLHDKAYADLQVDRAQGFADLLRQFRQTQGGLSLANSQLSTIKADTLNDIESAEAARRASVAAALKFAKEHG